MAGGLSAQSAVAAEPGLIGQWTFENASDSTGKWGPLTLRGNASISNGELAVTPSGGFAQSGAYSGPMIGDKTPISWVRLDDLTRAGSPLSLHSAAENFDAIVYAERQTGRWMAGSDYFRRTQDFVPGVNDSATGPGTTHQLAIS